jgi:rootletin
VLREELAVKEDEWQEEERVFKEYYISEHNRLLNLWRDVVSLKRLFTEMKFATERDFSKLQGDIGSLSSQMMSTCNNTNLKIMKLQASTMQPTVSTF